MNLSVTLQALIDEHGFGAVKETLFELKGAEATASTSSDGPQDPTQPGTGPGHDPKP